MPRGCDSHGTQLLLVWYPSQSRMAISTTNSYADIATKLSRRAINVSTVNHSTIPSIVMEATTTISVYNIGVAIADPASLLFSAQIPKQSKRKSSQE